MDELPGVLWAHITTYKTATGETPFALTFGHEAVVSVEIGMGTHRTKYFDKEQNNKQIYLKNGGSLEKSSRVSTKRSSLL